MNPFGHRLGSRPMARGGEITKKVLSELVDKSFARNAEQKARREP